MNLPTQDHVVTAVRWIARVLSVLLLGLMIALAIGEAKPEHLREMALGYALFTILVGLVLAWKWEGLGSLLILGGFAVFALVNWSIRTLQPYPLHNPFFGFLITGLLFSFCWWKTRKNAPRQ